MARISGKAGQVWADIAPGPSSEADVILGVTSWDLDLKGDAVDTTGMDSGGAKEFLPGLTEGTGSVEAFADGTLDTDIRPGTLLHIQLLYADGDTKGWFGTAICTGLKPNVQVEGAVKYTIGLQYSGTITYDTLDT